MAAATLSAKERVISEEFYHRERGFGSLQDTLKAARARDPTITRSDVREFLAKQEIRQRRKPLKVNSYIPNLARDEFQCDLADFGERANPRYGFVCIDIFTKKACIIPVRDKTAHEVAVALKTALDELGYPSLMYSDEGGEFHGQFAKVCADVGADVTYSRTGGRFVERLIRTLKLDIFERRKTYGGNWSQYAKEVIDRYKEHVHSATGYTPNHLAWEEYDFPLQKRAYERMAKIAKQPVTHETIAVGDHVKIRVKPKSAGYKETFNSWSDEVYTVSSIDLHQQAGTLYHLEGYRRPLLRFELLKVHDVMRPVAGEVRSVLQQRLRVRPPAPPAEAAAALRAPRAPVPLFRPITRSAARASSSSGGMEPGPLPVPPAVRADVEQEVRARPAPILFRRRTRSQV